MANARARILLIDGHPDGESFVSALSQSYVRGARASGAEVRKIVIRELDFTPNLRFGYRKRTELEPDLLAAQESLRWSEHIVVVHPVWWGSYPAIMKGFFDRILLPGFFFKKTESTYSWKKLLSGRSGRIIYTLDTPRVLWWLSGKPSYSALKWVTLGYCGVSPIRGAAFGIVRTSTPEQRARWLAQTEKLGARRSSFRLSGQLRAAACDDVDGVESALPSGLRGDRRGRRVRRVSAVVVVAVAVAAVLAALAALHVYWACGGRWPGADEESLARTVVGGPPGMRMPGAVACVAVAIGLAAAAAVVVAAASIEGESARVFSRVGACAVAAAFTLRGVGGFFDVRLRASVRESPYARWNVRLFSPLCVALAAATWLVVVLAGR